MKVVTRLTITGNVGKLSFLAGLFHMHCSTFSPFRPVLDDPRSQDDPAFLPSQFQKHQRKDSRSRFSFLKSNIPWQSVCLGLFLFAVGSACLLTLLWDMWHGYDEDEVHEHLELSPSDNRSPPLRPVTKSERFYPLLMLGLITFIPGCYVSFFIVTAFLGVGGVTFEDIPQ